MKIDLDTVRPTSRFGDVEPSDGFLFGGHLYMKLESLMRAERDTNLPHATKDIGGYNAVRLDIGRPGSFKNSTPVRPVEVVVVREEK
jgi:hypothetical protein